MFGKNKEKAKHILILGLGGVGYYLAKRLQQEEFSITIIEPEMNQIRHADDTIDARVIKGEAMDINCWREAGAEKMDCLIAVTNHDETNMMAAQIADAFGIPKKICRIRSSDFGMPDSILSEKDLKIDFITHPEEITAQEICKLIKIHAANSIIEVASGEVELISTRIQQDSPFANKLLREISQLNIQFPFRVVAIARGISTIIPSGNDQLLPNDHIVVMANKANHDDIIELAGVSHKTQQRVMILGGGLIGSRIGELLQDSVSVKLLEKNQDRAEELQDKLPKVEVLHGDGSDGEALSLAGLKDIDTLIAATDNNETNIMSCLLAKNLIGSSNGDQRAEGKTIALVNKEDYLVLATSIGIDIALNKKIIAGNEILKFIRRSQLLSVVHLHSFNAEVAEIIVSKNAPITKKPLSKLDPYFLDNMIVGGVYRDNEWNIAVGDTHIQENERVIVICSSKKLNEIRKLFAE